MCLCGLIFFGPPAVSYHNGCNSRLVKRYRIGNDSRLGLIYSRLGSVRCGTVPEVLKCGDELFKVKEVGELMNLKTLST